MARRPTEHVANETQPRRSPLPLGPPLVLNPLRPILLQASMCLAEIAPGSTNPASVSSCPPRDVPLHRFSSSMEVSCQLRCRRTSWAKSSPDILRHLTTWKASTPGWAIWATLDALWWDEKPRNLGWHWQDWQDRIDGRFGGSAVQDCGRATA